MYYPYRPRGYVGYLRSVWRNVGTAATPKHGKEIRASECAYSVGSCEVVLDAGSSPAAPTKRYKI
nr:MAG TPA: hypothetical protein [Caudoviricetes sp.]